MSELCLGELAALATAILWTLSALVWTATGKRIGALSVSFLRVAMVCALLAICGRVFRGHWTPTDVPLQTWYFLGMAGFFWFFMSDFSLFKAFILIGPRQALMIMSLTPPLAAVLSNLCIGDPLGPWQWLAMGITLLGVTWVILEQPNGENCTTPKDCEPLHEDQRPTGADWQQPSGSSPRLAALSPCANASPSNRKHGIALAGFAAASQAVAMVLSKRGTNQCDALAATTIAMLGALAGYLVFITATRYWPKVFAAAKQGRTMSLLACGVVIGPFVGVATDMIALRYAPAGVVATIIATMPVLILPFSILLHREKVTFRAIAGAAVAVAGVAMLVL
jgi:drug/metabolite transporter (DMT)-like permease